MHQQVPLVRMQIKSLRNAARSEYSNIGTNEDFAQIGSAFTSVMMSGFALELGLKVFYMSFYKRRPSGHNLKALYDDLPPFVTEAIAHVINFDNLARLEIPIFALKVSENIPLEPEEAPLKPYGTVEQIIESSSSSFIKSRYFFEGVSVKDWSFFDVPVLPMLELSTAFDSAYENLAMS